MKLTKAAPPPLFAVLLALVFPEAVLSFTVPNRGSWEYCSGVACNTSRDIFHPNSFEQCNSGFHLEGYQCDAHRNGSVSRSTALFMGIRSFLNKRIIRERKDEDDEDGSKENHSPEDIQMALEAIKADLDAVAYTDDENTSKNNGGEATSNAQLTSQQQQTSQEYDEPLPGGGYYGETIQERINRVKSGSMTEEEKAAFLNTALTRTVPSSNKKYNAGPPIRQSIPSENESAYSMRRVTTNGPSPTPTSPFPTDSLWNTVIGKGRQAKDGSKGNTGYSGTMGRDAGDGPMADAAKRQYLEMVTNPDRFRNYAAMGGSRAIAEPGSTSSPNPPSPLSVDNTDIDENSDENAFTTSEPPEVEIETTTSLPTATSTSSIKNDLASRLEKAAIAQEERDAQAKLKREQERQAELEETAALERKRQDEFRRKELEKEARRIAEQEREEKELKRKRQQEEEKMKEMLAKQDEYWKKKLEEEERRREKLKSEEEKLEEEKEVQKREMKDRVSREKKEKEKIEIELLREEERRREDASEGEILKEVAEKDLLERERNYEIMQESAAKLSRTVIPDPPKLEEVSAATFVQEQAKKKAALDKLMKEQEERLRSMNSPLPTPATSPIPSMTSVPKTPRPVVMPSTTPTVSSKTRSSSRSANNSMSPSPSARPNLSLSDLTTLNKKKKAEKEVTKATEVAKNPVPTKNLDNAPTTPRLSLAQMTMLKKDDRAGTNEKKPISKVKSAARTQTTTEKKGPIRQRVVQPKMPAPNDSGEDEFFEFDRSGENKNMSIKDIMARQKVAEDSSTSGSGKGNDEKEDAKRKSRMWGIDIDQFK